MHYFFSRRQLSFNTELLVLGWEVEISESGVSVPFCRNCWVCGYRIALTSFVRHFWHLSDKHHASCSVPAAWLLLLIHSSPLACRVPWAVIFHRYSPRPFRGPKPCSDSVCLGGSSRDRQQLLHRRASCLPVTQVCSCTDGLQLLEGNRRAFQFSAVFLLSLQQDLFRCTYRVNSPLFPRI